MSIKKKILRNLLTIIVAFAAYILLFHHMAVNDIMSTLLTAGNQASVIDMILSMIFVSLRFFIVVLLPGTVPAMAASLVWEYIATRKKQS